MPSSSSSKKGSSGNQTPPQDQPPPVEDISAVVQDKVRQKLRDFSSLLDDIETTTDKKKTLWREIYENAVMDRENAYIMFLKLYQHVHDDSSQHAIHGPTIAKYLERMNKSNEQLIRLAELVAEAEKKSDDINPEDMFRKISDS